MNWRLDHPPALDVSISRHMGLYAVAHLAARHGIRIKLRPGVPQGLSALVWLPGTLARRERAASGPSRTSVNAGASTGAYSLADGSGAAPVRTGPRIGPLARAGGGRHRGALSPATGEQPALLPARGTHEARPATAWFAAKRPSGGAQPTGPAAAGWSTAPGPERPGLPGASTPPGGYAPGSAPGWGSGSALGPGSGPGTGSGSGSGDSWGSGDSFRARPYSDAPYSDAPAAETGDGVPDPVALTGAGLPRRTPRTSARPGPSTPGFGLPAQTADDPGAAVPALAAPTGGPAGGLPGRPAGGRPGGLAGSPAAGPAGGGGSWGRASAFGPGGRGAPGPAAPASNPAPYPGAGSGAGRPGPLPTRPRSPEAVRSRLAGFQLGGRDADHAGPGQPAAPSAEEENSR
jgi:hypothetical protein